MNDAKLAWKIREQLAGFSGKLSEGLPKVAQRLVQEVLYGVQARGSVKLSEIGRALGEATQLKKIIERLGRQLERQGLREQIRHNLLRQAAGRITQRTLLVIDPTDLSKPYARRMEYLARVRDGSKGELADGYWCLEVIAAQRGTAEGIPLYQELYSQEAPDFVSENAEILRAIEAITQATAGRGIWVMDRGGDREKLLRPLLDSGKEFLIRQRGDRHLIWRRKAQAVHTIAARCRLPYRQRLLRHEGEKEIYELRFGATPVRFPGCERPLSLVVVEGLGSRPLLVLATGKVQRSFRRVWQMVESYLTRWRVEEAIRFLKQSYQLEDIRLLRYERLRTMATLVMAVAYFAAVHLGKRAKLTLFAQHLLKASQRIYGVPEFRLYALADGIKQVLFSSRRGIGAPPRPPDPGILLLPLEP